VTIRTKVARQILAAGIVMASACDASVGEGGDRASRGQDEADVPSSVVTWGCQQRIPSNMDALDPRWREEATVVGVRLRWTEGDFSAFRPHERADLQVKLPVIIEGHSGATVWIPLAQRTVLRS
jgi:hypothetical protein